MKNFKFDVSWKGIILAIIIGAFLLSALDSVVHGSIIPDSIVKMFEKETEIEPDYREKFQAVEDRQMNILKKEGKLSKRARINVHTSIQTSLGDDVYLEYDWYDGEQWFRDESVDLPMEFIDRAYYMTKNISTDSIWESAIRRLARFYEL